MGLGDRIKAYRKAAKLTQTELGAAAGIRKSAVSMIESGKSEPSLKVLQAFAGKLGVAVEDLLGETALDPGDLSEAHVQILTALNYLSDEQAEILLNVMKALGMAWDD